MMKKIKRIVCMAAAFWCCFQAGDRFVCGNPVHFEGWYDNDGKEMQIIWMGDGERYIVYEDDLMMIYYDDDAGLAIG